MDAQVGTHAAGLAQRIDDRRGVHPELDQEGEKDLQVAVLGGHRGDDGAEAQGQAREHDDEEGEEQGVPGEMCVAGRVDEVVDQIDDQEESELDAEAEQVAEHVGDWHHQAGEIDLAEDGGVGDEGVGGLGQAFGEVVPHAGAGEVEERPGHAVGRDAGDAAEHDHVHDDGEGRLHHEPGRSQDGLLVLGDYVALDKEAAQVPVLP